MPATAPLLRLRSSHAFQRRIVRATLLAVTAASVAGAAPVSAQQSARGTLVVTGRVVSQDSSAVANARVVISSGGAIATTDSGGRFTMPRLAAGVHAIEIWHDSSSTIQIPALNLPAGDTVHLTATMTSKPATGPAADSAARAAVQARGGRGASQAPLLLVDGVIVGPVPPSRDNSPPQDITTMQTVAIDVTTGNAAMQIFGSRAQFGVIAVVTRVVCPAGATVVNNVCRGG